MLSDENRRKVVLGVKKSCEHQRFFGFRAEYLQKVILADLIAKHQVL